MKKKFLLPGKILIGIFVLIISLLTFLAAISLIQTKKQQTTSEWVRKSFVKILTIEDNMSLLRDAQARHRAFLLTKDTSFNKEYDSLKIRIKKTSADLDSLFAENQTQVQLVREIHSLLQRRYQNMDIAINLSETHKIEELSPLLMDGYAVMDSLLTKVKLLESIEEQVLKDKIEEKDSGDKKVQLWILLLSLSSLLIVLLSFLILRKEIYKRTLAQNTSEILDKMVNERTSEILNVSRTLKENNIKLKRVNSELNAFNFITNHDMQEPLRKIETFIMYIQENNPEGISPELKPYFERIVLSAKRMRELIDSISIYSKYSRNMEFIQVNLNEVLAKSLEKTNKLITQKNAKIEVGDLPTITANPQQMEALFMHLINNALKFSKDGRAPVIHITTKKIQNNSTDCIWKIDFSDNGIGFDPKYLDRIFTIFQRLHDKEKYPGTGIGLPICKKIVENHNGSISANSAPGQGTTISIFLPERQLPFIDNGENINEASYITSLL